jgi:plasmid rolling circle replication initiator protein Rep
LVSQLDTEKSIKKGVLAHSLKRQKISLAFIMSDVLLLRDISERDKKIDNLKCKAMEVSKLLEGTIHDKYFHRQQKCANFLSYALTSEGLKLHQTYSTTKSGKKVPRIRFCRSPGCVLCEGRRAACWQCRGFKAAPRILADYPEAFLLFLTLTLKNPLIDNLFDCLTAMQTAWRHMSREYRVVKTKKGKVLRTEGNPQWQALGWLKSLEITKSDDNYCHPHYHVMLLMPPSYFQPSSWRTSGYMTTEEWGQMWAKYMKLEYQPITDIRKIDGDWKKAIPEICKYTTKASDLMQSQEWLVKYISQMKGMRRTELGGCFKKYFRDDDGEENLINLDDEKEILEEANLPIVEFVWSHRKLMGNDCWNYQALSHGWVKEGSKEDSGEVLGSSLPKRELKLELQFEENSSEV